jgi:hypothetical protein
LPVIGISRRGKSAAGAVAVRSLAIKRDHSPSKTIKQEKSQQLLAFVDG